MKKVLKSLLVLVLVLVQVFPMFIVNAEQVNTGSIEKGNKGKITITNPLKDETYKIYQILELESYTTGKAYAYKVKTKWVAFVNSVKGTYLNVDKEGYVSWVFGADKEAFAKAAMKYAKDNTIAEEDSAVAGNDAIVFDKLELGYYLVDSSTGALCSLDTTDNEVEITEKNTIPTVLKEVAENGNFGSKNDANIGDVVTFKTTITVGKGADNYKLYDNMSAGLDFQGITSVVLTGEGARELDLTTDYTVSSNDTYDFIIDFTDSLEENLVLGNTIVVTYTAKVNKNAVIDGNGNDNVTNLTYGDQNTPSNESKTITYVFKFNVKKINSDKELLSGAKFELYASDQETKINLVLENGVYRVATPEEAAAAGFKSAVIEAGEVTIKGLDSGTYYLEETVAPDGYNKLADKIEVTIRASYVDEESTVTVSGTNDEYDLVNYTGNLVTITNITGAELPSTGGMGTVLFLTIGSLMVLGFGVLLVTKLRMAKMAL